MSRPKDNDSVTVELCYNESMIPGKYNMVCPQGSTFVQELTYSVNDVPVDLTGYSAAMQVREKYSSAIPISSVSTGSGGIEILGGGLIRITIAAATTADFIAKEYVYDIELTSPASVVNRILEGKFIVTPEVTR